MRLLPLLLALLLTSCRTMVLEPVPAWAYPTNPPPPPRPPPPPPPGPPPPNPHQ
ncbi:MAG: hypothetical protein NTX13_14970 [Acidobacteria bacterium]|nr:hypothetical protein [Acidobacteriota bacterium]